MPRSHFFSLLVNELHKKQCRHAIYCIVILFVPLVPLMVPSVEMVKWIYNYDTDFSTYTNDIQWNITLAVGVLILPWVFVYFAYKISWIIMYMITARLGWYDDAMSYLNKNPYRRKVPKGMEYRLDD